jgi:hypothetical protein
MNVHSGSPFSYFIPKNTFISPGSTPLKYSLKMANGANLPDWLSFNTEIRQLTGKAPKEIN